MSAVCITSSGKHRIYGLSTWYSRFRAERFWLWASHSA
jgi:hypothetical protein